jgi:chromosomal replication initiator protein
MQVQEASGSEHWNRVKKRLRAELGEDVFTSWFARVDFEDHANGIVRLSVPTRFLKQWIQSHYLERLIGLWQRECEDVLRIELTVRGAVRARPAPQAALAGAVRPSPALKAADKPRLEAVAGSDVSRMAPAATQPRTAAPMPDGLEGASLDPKYTFDSFVEGDSNALALAAARQIATASAVTFNPLYVHASVGLGKTHLMQAIAKFCAGVGKAGALPDGGALHVSLRRGAEGAVGAGVQGHASHHRPPADR